MTFDWSQYTITASNSQGSSQGIILIRVTDVAPTSIGYPESNLLLRVGVPMTGMSPTTLSVVDYWSIDRDLPSGNQHQFTYGRDIGNFLQLYPI